MNRQQHNVQLHETPPNKGPTTMLPNCGLLFAKNLGSHIDDFLLGHRLIFTEL